MSKLLYFYCFFIEKIYRYGKKWDDLSPKEEDAIDFAHKNINPEPKRKIDSTKYSLEYCLVYSGETINDRFRQDRIEDSDLEIANMVALHTTKVPLVLYRGVCHGVFAKMRENAKNIKNADLHEKSFMQTSLVKGHERNEDHHLRIYVPAGTQAVYLGNVNYEQYYYEVDLQRGGQNSKLFLRIKNI